jgi:Flp pilus assembly protein protease CpaA
MLAPANWGRKMAGSDWSIPRILLIWCAWPILSVVLIVFMLAVLGGGSIDLLHGPARWVALALILVPPILATLLWGRR